MAGGAGTGVRYKLRAKSGGPPSRTPSNAVRPGQRTTLATMRSGHRAPPTGGTGNKRARSAGMRKDRASAAGSSHPGEGETRKGRRNSTPQLYIAAVGTTRGSGLKSTDLVGRCGV